MHDGLLDLNKLTRAERQALVRRVQFADERGVLDADRWLSLRIYNAYQADLPALYRATTTRRQWIHRKAREMGISYSVCHTRLYLTHKAFFRKPVLHRERAGVSRVIAHRDPLLYDVLRDLRGWLLINETALFHYALEMEVRARWAQHQRQFTLSKELTLLFPGIDRYSLTTLVRLTLERCQLKEAS